MSTCKAVVLGLICLLANAQVEQGIIFGTLRDGLGAVVTGAKVTITQLETNTAFVTETDVRGSYRSIPLRPGHYSVAAEAPGFKRATQTGITLDVQQQALVDLVLEVGALTEQVTITADAPLLQTADGSRGEVIDNKKIVDLPLNGRQYLDLGLLTAGTNVPPPGARFGGFSAGGLRVTHNNYLLDGMDNNSNQQTAQSRTAQVVSPSVDAVQEFKVQTNNYSAEFGRNLGGVVNVILKSGSNEIHGGVFEFLRNDTLDARNFFDDPGNPVPPYKRNQFGGLIGGPVVRNKTFYFFDYEGTRLRTSRTELSTIPTELERNGDFSVSVFNNRPVQIFDPATYNAQTRARQEFPNATIPRSRLDPVGAKVASFYPLPNRAGFINNFLYNPLDSENTDQFDLKLDHNFDARNMLYGRFSYQNFKRLGGGTLPPPAFGTDDSSTTNENRPRSLVVSYGRVFSPALFNTVKVGFNRLLTNRTPPIEENLNAAVGIRGVPWERPGLMPFSITGFRGVGTQGNTPHNADSQTRQLTNDLSWMRGRHNVKTGLNFAFIQAPLVVGGRAQFSFNGNFSRQSSNNTFGNPMADLLLGIPFNSNIGSVTQANQRRRLYHAYVQDEFKITERFTLSMGLRYEYTGPWFEKYNRYANFDIDTDPANPRLLIAKDGGIRERSTLDPDYTNFAPRVSLAYRVGRRTVVRTGYGIYYGGVENGGGAYLASNPPFLAETTFNTDSIQPGPLLRTGFPDGATTSNITNLRTISQDRGNRTGYAQQWNFTIQRELARNLSLDVGYAATKGNRLLRRVDGNVPPPGQGQINARRPYKELEVPGLNYIIRPLADMFRRAMTSNSNYHSLQIKAEKRLSGGLSFLGSYVFSKAISDARGDAEAGGTSNSYPQNIKDLRAEKALADEHFPHRFVLSFNYDLPFGRGKTHLAGAPRAVDLLLGGWAIGGIATANSGRRVTPAVTGNPSNTTAPDRPNATGISPELDGSQRSLQRWFNTDAFVINAPFTFGNASRNVLSSPGRRNLDFAAYKYFSVTESVRLQFRAEFFNSTNTPPFGAPGATLGTGQFGVINNADPGRIIQFGLKLNF